MIARDPLVMFVAPSAYTLGGVATWLSYLDPSLRQRGWRTTVALTGGPRHHCALSYVQVHRHASTMEVFCRTQTPEGRRRALQRAIASARPDILLVVNIPDALAAAATLPEIQRQAIKSVMVCHNITPSFYDDMAYFREHLDAVVCTNRLSCRLATKCGGIEESRVYYAPYGTQLPAAVAAKKDAPTLRLAYVGRLDDDQKRIFDLPPILASLRRRGVPFELTIAGSGPDESALRRKLASFTDDGSVRFLGCLDTAQLPEKVLQQADILLLTSYWETGPIVLWEAMSHGVACVTSRYVGSGLEGALQHGINVMQFSIGNTDEAAEQIAQLWSHPEQRRALAANGRRLVEQRYSIPHSCDLWDTVLHNILAQTSNQITAPLSDHVPCGRLDRWVGPHAAEQLRSLMRLQGQDSGPGGEWPHVYRPQQHKWAALWQLAEQLDRDGANPNFIPPRG